MTKSRRQAGPGVALTEGAIRITWGGRRLTILSSPQPPDAEEPADFVVDMDQILAWDPPHDQAEISVDDLQAIAQAIEDEFERLGLVVEFE